MKAFKILKKGIAISLEGCGNYTKLADGFSIGGALDEHSYLWGNYLLGNNPKSLSLEITIGQTALIALNNFKITITGADLNFTINGKIAPLWLVLNINKNDILKWQKPINGIRAYLSISGGFDYSKNLTNDELLLAKNIHNNTTKHILRKFIPDYNTHLNLRIIVNNDINFWREDDFTALFNNIFQISSNNNRVAYKLNKQSIKPKTPIMLSEANNYGSMQITSDGTPIIMLKDCPTIGGYPKIGNIFSLDLAKLAQKTSNNYISFEPITINNAQKLKIEFNNFFSIN